MAQTVPYQPIEMKPSGVNLRPNIYSLPAAAAQTIVEGDIVTVASGQLSKAAANPTASSIAGMAMFGTLDLYHQVTPARNTILGTDQTGTALVPTENQNLHFVGLGAGMKIEISLNQATVLAATLVGTAVGLGYDATSGYFFADPTQANKPFNIVEISSGPDSLQSIGPVGSSKGVIGDNGGRVVIQANTSLAFQ